MAHRAQRLNYLRATDIEVGLLLNFGERPEFKRLVSIISKREPTIRKKSVLSAATLLFATGPRTLNSSFHPAIHFNYLPVYLIDCRTIALPRKFDSSNC